MPVKCTNCGGAHPSWDCRKPKKILGGLPVAAAEENAERTGSYGEATKIARPERRGQVVTDGETSTLPKPKIGRPRTGFNKKEYNRQFTADLRTIKRLGLNCTVKEWREKNDI